MARVAPKQSPYRCSDCGWTAAKWAGRCGECQAWGTVNEVGATRARGTAAGRVSTAAVPIGQVDLTAARSQPTGVSEFDRVLGGGIVPGAVLLLAGEPGVGKSTLLLDVASRWADTGRRTLYVTGEESAAQVRLRAERIGALADELYLAAEIGLCSSSTPCRPSAAAISTVPPVGSPRCARSLPRSSHGPRRWAWRP